MMVQFLKIFDHETTYRVSQNITHDRDRTTLEQVERSLTANIDNQVPLSIEVNSLRAIVRSAIAWLAYRDPSKVMTHVWNNEPIVRTDRVRCLLCSDDACVIIHAPLGCTCSPNKYQPRCSHHLQRAYDTGEQFEIVEDFRVGDNWPHRKKPK
jgi:hypothetical protein